MQRKGNRQHDLHGRQPQQREYDAGQAGGRAFFFPALESGLGAQFARQAAGIAQRGGNFLFAAPRRRAFAEMRFVIQHQILDLGARQAGEATAELV